MDLDDHPATALGAVAGRLQSQGPTAVLVTAVGQLAAAVAAVDERGHSVF
ncbi:hypothetical protein [Kribbella sp. NPDC050470]